MMRMLSLSALGSGRFVRRHARDHIGHRADAGACSWLRCRNLVAGGKEICRRALCGAEDRGRPDGVALRDETYSQAELKYVGVPCTARTEDRGRQDGGLRVETYSQAEQKYVGLPCAHQ